MALYLLNHRTIIHSKASNYFYSISDRIMKTHYIIIVVAAVIVSLLGTNSLVGYQSELIIPSDAVKKIVESGKIEENQRSEEQSATNNSIFSRTTILTLFIAVMGIVALRSKTDS